MTLMQRKSPKPTFVPPSHPGANAPAPSPVATLASDALVGLEIVLTEIAPARWRATAYPATATEVLDDVEHPEETTFDVRPDQQQHIPRGSWVDEWTPASTAWGHPAHRLPPVWTSALDELVQRARRRHGL